MILLFWIFVFCVALFVMLKGADWFLISSERIGRSLGLSAFIIGAVIIGIGTSLPELAVSIFALLGGVQEVIASNAIGSNISNILLVVGVAAIIARKLTVSKDIIDLDLPMLVSSTVIFMAVAWDRHVELGEAIILVGAYVIYFLYSIFAKDTDIDNEDPPSQEKITFKLIILLILSGAALTFGAKFLIDSVTQIAEILNIRSSIIAITAVAVGTSLPELIVSVKAALAGKSEMAIGNIFGSNTFNLLMVVGLPAIFTQITIDPVTFSVGLPIMAAATFMFLVSGISKKIYIWEGAMFIMFYVFFIGRLFGFF